MHEICRNAGQRHKAYASKVDGFTKFGDESKQGEKHDLLGVRRLTETKRDPLELAEHQVLICHEKFQTVHEQDWGTQEPKTIQYDYTPKTIYITLQEAGTGKTQWACLCEREKYPVPDLVCLILSVHGLEAFSVSQLSNCQLRRC